METIQRRKLLSRLAANPWLLSFASFMLTAALIQVNGAVA